jgi:NitT/TauT family transport system permease protein
MRSFLTPFLVVMQSVPVMSVIILAIIWFSTDNVAVFSVFLMTLPIVAIGTEEGIRAMDPGLLKMAAIYRLNRSQRLLSIILPSVVPFVVAGLNASLALTWKVVVAAEVLAQPLHAVGTGMALAKVRLETEAVMAWTLTAVVLSGVSHFVFAIVRKAFHWRMDAGESG